MGHLRRPAVRIRGMQPRVFALPEGPAVELSLTPRLESWERHDHPMQTALREFVAHVRELIEPVIETTRGELAVRLDVGLPETADPLWERDLDNYLFPIARATPERVVSVWGTKGRDPRSFVRVERAVEVAAPAGWMAFEVPRAPGTERYWKAAVRRAVSEAAQLPAGPVGLQFALAVGPDRSWPAMWKASIDGLEPLLGKTYEDRIWNPQDGRVVRLGFHKTVDHSLGHDASMTLWARPGDEHWPELCCWHGWSLLSATSSCAPARPGATRRRGQLYRHPASGGRRVADREVCTRSAQRRLAA